MLAQDLVMFVWEDFTLTLFQVWKAFRRLLPRATYAGGLVRTVDERAPYLAIGGRFGGWGRLSGGRLLGQRARSEANQGEEQRRILHD